MERLFGKDQAKKYYESIHALYCPYFEDEVFFQKNGFQHLVYKNFSKRQVRSVKEQLSRLKLLPLASDLIGKTTTVQEYEMRSRVIKVKSYKKKTMKNVQIRYWGFIAILQKKKIKVIVRQVGNGKKHFYSLYPKWITRQSVESKKTPADR